ncbi:MAG: hypothetical protein C4346_06845 [Chloroflexota bacterium]
MWGDAADCLGQVVRSALSRGAEVPALGAQSRLKPAHSLPTVPQSGLLQRACQRGEPCLERSDGAELEPRAGSITSRFIVRVMDVWQPPLGGFVV